ncbi:hypothetical protein D3C86_1249480 [compost metagenome]
MGTAPGKIAVCLLKSGLGLVVATVVPAGMPGTSAEVSLPGMVALELVTAMLASGTTIA